MEVVLYSEEMSRMWDAFVWKANNGTLFHTRKFLSYHPSDRFEDSSLMFIEGNRVFSVFPAVVKETNSGKVLVSHNGASYGGFVHKEDLSVRSSFDLIESLLDWAREKEIVRIEMTLPPVIYYKQPNHYLDFALHKNGFQYKKREMSSIVPLDFTVEQILNKFKPEARTAYRKAVKSGLEVRESSDFALFYPILEKNLALRHHVSPTHTLKELQSLKRLFPDRIVLFGTFFHDKMVAGVTNFICNDRVVLAFYISHNEVYQKYRPVNHLFYEIIRWSIENGYRFLDFGIFTVNEEPNWGLGKFKESFGAKGIFRDTFEKSI